MSLFGQPPASSASSSSNLFSLNLNTGGAGEQASQANKKRASIFDTASATNPPQLTQPMASNLFGGAGTGSTPFSLGAPPTRTTAPSIFNTTATSGPSSGGIFGGTAPTTTTATTSSGIFAAAPAPAPFSLGSGTSAPTFGPTFGASANPQRSIGGAFGATSGTSLPALGTFGTSAAPQSGHSGQSDNPQPQNRDPANFSSLIERQKKRVRLQNETQNGRIGQLPTLSMDLGDLARRAQQIGGRADGTVHPTLGDSRAHYLLAGSGVSPGKAYKDFSSLNADIAPEEVRAPKEPFDPDNGKYFRDLQQKGRKQMMKENMAQVYREVDTFIEESLGIDFEEQRQKIMEHFGLVPKDDNIPEDGGRGSFGKSSRRNNAFAETPNKSTRSVFGRSGMDKSLIGTPGMNGSTTSFFGDDTSRSATSLMKGQTARDLRDKERLFVEKVEKLNAARLQEKPFAIMHNFAEVEQSAGQDSPQHLAAAYHALGEITKETTKTVLASDPVPVKERQHASTYLDDQDHGSNFTKLRRQILDGSRTYLERAFYRDLEAMVDKNPREAQLGGRPTVVNKVRAYIRVRAARRDLAPDGSELQQIGEEGDYCWILIFYLLRSGFVSEAAEYVNNDPAFQSTDKRFTSYLGTYARSSNRRLSRKLQDMINGEYQQRLRIAPEHSIDPYRMACYKIVGRCDLSKRNLESVGQGVEDWIWLQFALAREIDSMEELAGESFGLEQICETITEIGQKHFQKGQIEGSGGYGTYFFMQILAGMFEQAVEYLHGFNPVSAVHFAIALAYYGLLRVCDYTVAGNELLTFSTTGQPQINFVPLVAYYTAAFRAALPVSAVDYLALICLNSDLKPASLGSTQTAACHECLRQLCLETREFARLLGDIRSDGTRIPGAIEDKSKIIHLTTHADFLKAVTIQAAAIADERGQVADAVLLYHLSEDYDNVVAILNRSLADACTLDLGESPMQLQPLKPRRQPGQAPSSDSSQTVDGPQSSLSLTQSTSSPVDLAKNMIILYNENAAYYGKINTANRKTIGALLHLLSARSHLEATPPRYMQCLEELNELSILPLQAQGSIPVIRSAASAFGALPQLLARCAGVSVVWAVRAIGGERENMLKQGSWDGGNGNDNDAMKEQLSSMAKDLMVFAGLVKYKLPSRVYSMLTSVGGEVGGY